MRQNHPAYISQFVTRLSFNFVEYNLDIRIDVF